MKNNFLDYIDEQYIARKKTKDIKHKDYRYYFELSTEDFTYKNNFRILRIDKSRILYCVKSLQIDLTDVDIISTICLLEDGDIQDILERLILFYKGHVKEFKFSINDVAFSGVGMSYCTGNEKKILLEADVEIEYNSFLFIINMILAKDTVASMNMKEEEQVDLCKRTLTKYILLIKYYKYDDKKIEESLLAAGFPRGKNLKVIYQNPKKSKELNKVFDNDLFEKLIIL
jgi:hypothetical protein